jgi:hypothetical protein
MNDDDDERAMCPKCGESLQPTEPEVCGPCCDCTSDDESPCPKCGGTDEDARGPVAHPARTDVVSITNGIGLPVMPEPTRSPTRDACLDSLRRRIRAKFAADRPREELHFDEWLDAREHAEAHVFEVGDIVTWDDHLVDCLNGTNRYVVLAGEGEVLQAGVDHEGRITVLGPRDRPYPSRRLTRPLPRACRVVMRRVDR